MTDAQRTEYRDYLRARIGNDFGDFGDLIIRKAAGSGANAFGTGLGSAEAPEPVKPSPPFGCHPISQVSTRDGECANNGSPSDK